MAIILDRPNNPSGRVYPRADIEALATVLVAHGKATGRFPYLIIDEPYRDIVYDGMIMANRILGFGSGLGRGSGGLGAGGMMGGMVAIVPTEPGYSPDKGFTPAGQQLVQAFFRKSHNRVPYCPMGGPQAGLEQVPFPLAELGWPVCEEPGSWNFWMNQCGTRCPSGHAPFWRG
ncbi:MAG: aminotransferase class I/II-fold pyridoxal phosphate-dependent enzyme [Spirochaetota bacterium]